MAAEVVVGLAVAVVAVLARAEREALAGADFSGALAQPASSTTTIQALPKYLERLERMKNLASRIKFILAGVYNSVLILLNFA